jgi:glycosyltransferase involved in cell wall biosynthesis
VKTNVPRGCRPIRVLIVAPSLDILGGQAVQARRLIEGLSESAAVDVALLPVNPRLPGVFGRLQRVKYVRTVVTTIAYVASLFRSVPRCDVVHAFSASYFSYLLAPLPALFISRLFGRPSILNYRSGEASDHLARWPLSRWTIRVLPTVVIVPSGYLVEVFKKFGIQASSIVNFVPVEKLPFRRREMPRPVLFSNRNLEPLYNVECTLRAFRAVQSVHPHASLTVAGDGSERSSLEALCRQLQLRNVKFVGKVDQSMMARLYDDHDIYVNSPNIDNMPSSILEAFACGLPVVSTDAGGIPYVVDSGRTGLLVPCDDDRKLATNVLALLADPARAVSMADAARSECTTLYVWSQVRRHWEKCYERLASGAR